MRIERIRELVVAAVGFRIGPGWRPQKRKPKHIALGVVSILRFIEQAETVVAVAEVGPAERREFRRLPGVPTLPKEMPLSRAREFRANRCCWLHRRDRSRHKG